MRRGVCPLVLSVTALAGLAPATATELGRLDRLEVSYGEFLDDFADEVFPDGGLGEPTLYTVPCGTLSDTDEVGGTLTLAGPDDLGCPGDGIVSETAAGFFAAAGALSSVATFVGAIPAFGQSYGVIVSNLTSTDFVTLNLARGFVSDQIPDALVLALVDESFAATGFPVELLLLSSDPESHPIGNGVELRLALQRSGDGLSLLPHGQ